MSLPVEASSYEFQISQMYSYSIFGGHLGSELPFPELIASECDRYDWTLSLSRSAARRGGGELIGSGQESSCQIELYREVDRLRLYHSCTGSFDILNGGREIVWSPAPNVRMEAGRADVFGRVLAIAMHLQGVLTLHSSAVAIDSGAIAFIAPKHYGKSSLAMALTSAGARLITDDMLPIRMDAVPMAMPGVQTVRLRDDSARRLYQDGMQTRIGVDGKHVIHQSDSDRLLCEDAPLEAVYILSPVTSLPGEASVARSLLPPTAATMSLVTFMKVGPLLGSFGAATVLNRAAAVARVVSVYRLHVVRDIERLSEVVETICTWHQLSAPAGV